MSLEIAPNCMIPCPKWLLLQRTTKYIAGSSQAMIQAQLDHSSNLYLRRQAYVLQDI